MVTAVLVVSAGVVAVNLIPRGAVVELNPSRVLVLPFDNRTGDASLDQLGAMAADWLTEGLLALAGVVEPVPTERVMQLLRVRAEESTAPGVDTEGMAEATGAGTVVSGSYYQHGDSLEFQAQVFDILEGAVLGATDPVRGSVEEPGNAIGLLREAVTGILAARFDPMMQVEIPSSVRPPSYQAFRAYSSGLSAWMEGDHAEALRHLERASALDTTYVRTSILTTSAYVNLGQLAVAESIAVEAGKSSEGHIARYARRRRWCPGAQPTGARLVLRSG